MKSPIPIPLDLAKSYLKIVKLKRTWKLAWAIDRGRFKAGTYTGNCSRNGRGAVRLGGRLFVVSRVIWSMYHNKQIPDGYDIDHINGNPHDDRIENLRAVPHCANVENVRKKRKHNTTGLLGVFMHASGKYRSQIAVNGKQISLGLFTSKIKAHKAYVKAKRKMHKGCTI